MVQIAHGAFSGDRSGVVGQVNPWDDLQVWEDYRAKARTQPALVHVYLRWGREGRQYWDQVKVDALTARGEVLVVSWGPSTTLAAADDTAYNLATVLAGNHDAYIDNFAAAMAAHGKPVILPLMWEMNLAAFTWSVGIQNQTNQNSIDAWRYIVNRVRAIAPNALFAWVPWATTANLTTLYPGDAYVDYIGIDGFNNMSANASGVPWLTATQVFDTCYNHLTTTVAPSKPFMFKEVSCMEMGGDKAAWLTDFYNRCQQVYTKTRIVLWFDTDKRSDGEKDWRVNTSDTSLTAFQQVAARVESRGWAEAGIHKVGNNEVSSTNAAGITHPMPLDDRGNPLQVDDVLFWTLERGGGVNSINVPAGWTLYMEETDVNNLNGGSLRQMHLWHRITADSPSSWDVTTVGTATPTWHSNMTARRGCVKTGSPVEAGGAVGYVGIGGVDVPAGTYDFPPVTTGGPWRQVVAILSSFDATLTRVAQAAWPTRFNEIVENGYVTAGVQSRSTSIAETAEPGSGHQITPSAVVSAAQTYMVLSTYTIIPDRPELPIIYERLAPTAEVAQVNLPGGVLANVTEDVTVPDSLWKTAASDPTPEVPGPSTALGPFYASANAAWAGIAGTLTNPNNANGSTTGNYATLVNPTYNVDYARLYTYGTQFNAIPNDAEIVSVALTVRHHVSNAGRGQVGYQLASGGALIGSEFLYSTLPTVATDVAVGSLGAVPTVAQIKAADFGVRIRERLVVNAVYTFNLDRLALTITYRTGGTPGEIRTTSYHVAVDQPSRELYNHPEASLVRAWLRRRGVGADHPLARIEILEAGSGAVIQTPVEDQPISSSVGQYVEGFFTPLLLSSLDATDLEVRVVSPGAEAALVEVGAVDVLGAIDEYVPVNYDQSAAFGVALTRPSDAAKKEPTLSRSYPLNLSHSASSSMGVLARTAVFLMSLALSTPIFSPTRILSYALSLTRPAGATLKTVTTSRSYGLLASLLRSKEVRPSRSYGILTTLARAREVRTSRSYAVTVSLASALYNPTRVLSYALSLTRPNPVRSLSINKAYGLLAALRPLIRRDERSRSYALPLTLSRIREVRTSRSYAMAVQLGSALYNPTRVLSYALTLTNRPPGRIVSWAKAFSLTTALRPPVRALTIIRSFSLTLALQPLKEYRITKPFTAAVQFAQTRWDQARIIRYNLSLTRPGPKKNVQPIRSYALTTGLRTPVKTVSKILTRTLSPDFRPYKFLSAAKTFALQVRWTADGGFRQITEEVARNVEVFMQVLRGRRGSIVLTYRVVKSNVRGEDLGELPGYIRGTGSISMSNSRANAWELGFDMRELPDTEVFDPVRDFVKVYADVDHRGEVMSYPLGLYRLRKPSRRILKSHRVWHCQGFSLEDLLARHEPDVPYSVPAGVDALDRARAIISEQGLIPLDRILFPAVSAPLRNVVQFDATSNASGTSWLSICNALLNAAGYYAVQTDAEGYWITEKMGSQVVLQPDVSYDELYENMVISGVDEEYDDDRFANKIVIKSQDVEDTPPIVVRLFNMNPDSHGSVPYLGRVEQKTINLQTTISQAEMLVMAQAELEKASGFYRKLRLVHKFDPRVWAPRRIMGLYLTDQDGRALVDGRWNQVNSSVNLSRPATPMTTEVSRIEEI